MSTQQQLRRGPASTINVGIPAEGELWSATDRNGRLVVGDGNEVGGVPVSPLPYNYLNGTIAPDPVTPESIVDFSAGAFRASANDGDILAPVAISKDLSTAWVDGDGLGGFPSTLSAGIAQPLTTYHAFSLGKLRNGMGDIDAGFDGAVDASNLLVDASAYSYHRRRGSFTTDALGQVVPFIQRANFFQIEPVNVVSVSSPPTALTAFSLPVPSGIRVRPVLSIKIRESGSAGFNQLMMTNDPAIDATLREIAYFQPGDGRYDNMGAIDFLITESAQLQYSVSNGSTITSFKITLDGWYDDGLGM